MVFTKVEGHWLYLYMDMRMMMMDKAKDPK